MSHTSRIAEFRYFIMLMALCLRERLRSGRRPGGSAPVAGSESAAID